MENSPADSTTPQKDLKSFLAELGEEVREGFRKNRRVMSFAEFCALVDEHPRRHLRGAAQYTKDCFDHFGTTEVQTPRGAQTRYQLFDCAFANGKDRLIGQEEVQGKVYRAFCNFVRDGRISKLILLHGPNGSAKSTLVACIMRALEYYSTLEEGALYRFNWILPSQKLTRAGIGFGGQAEADLAGTDSYAYLDDDQIDVKLTDETHDHPLLLLPLARRRQLIDALLDKVQVGDSARFVVCDYIGNGDLSPRNKQIFEALLVSYKGDILKVLRHIQVERFDISRRYRQGAVTVEPQMAVDATAQQITADRSLAALPPALQALNMLRYDGELVEGNRGIVEFADLLKRPLEAYKYLLGTVEHASVPVGPSILYLDELFIASSNDLHLSAFKEIPEFQSFKGRMELIRVPYLLDYTQEEKIYAEQVLPSSVGKHVAPHAARVAALWGVLTRMRKPMAERYDKPLSDIVGKLNAFDKVELYAHRRAPAHLTPEQSKELLGHIDSLYSESDSYPIYEGRIGISPRELKTLLLNAAQNPHYRCLSPFAVLEEIDELVVKAVTVHEFLKQEPLPGAYHDHKRFIEIVREELLNIIDEEVRSAMGLIDERQYAEVFARYINHISHWIKREKVVNPVTGDLEEPDEKLMAEIEKTLGVSATKEEHRRDLIRHIAAWSIDQPQEAQRAQKGGKGLSQFDFTKIFPEQFKRLREAYFAERKKILKKTNHDLLAYLSEGIEEGKQLQAGTLDKESAERVRKTFETLQQRYGYNRDSARDALSYLLRKRYA